MRQVYADIAIVAAVVVVGIWGWGYYLMYILLYVQTNEQRTDTHTESETYG